MYVLKTFHFPIFNHFVFNLDYLIERECLVNKFISVPKDKGIETINKRKVNVNLLFSKGNLNCASFVAGIIEGILCNSGFVCSIEFK